MMEYPSRYIHGIIELQGIANDQNSVIPGLPGVGVQHVEPLRRHPDQMNCEVPARGIRASDKKISAQKA
jgi:hypothetical protein